MTNPYGGTTPPPASMMPYPVPARSRPSGWWWCLGGGLVVLALVCLVAGIIASVASVSDSVSSDDDTSVALDGQPHRVSLPHDEKGYLWRGLGVDRVPTCTVIDTSTGDTIGVQTSGTTSRTNDDGTFEAFGTFDTGSGEVTVTCAPIAGGSSLDMVSVGPDPHIGRSVALIMLTIFVPAALGLAGVIALIVTAVLWFTRAPRRGSAYAGNQPPPPGVSPM